MDPEILKALQEGHSPKAIAAELQARGLPVPPELALMPEPARADATATRAPVGGIATTAGVLGGTAYAGYRGAKALSPSSRAQRRIRDAVKAEGGADVLRQRLAEFERTGRGSQVVLSDLGEHLGAQADFAANSDDALRVRLSQVNRERRAGAPQRLLADAEQLAGYSAPNYLRGVSEQSQRDFAASPLGFEGLRQANPALPQQAVGRLAAFLESPRLTKAWQDAAAVGAQGPLPAAGASSFEVLQGLKERLDGLTEAAWRKGDGDLGKRLGAARDELVNILEGSVPGYREVSATYAQFGQHQRMLDAGLEAWSDHSVQVPDLEQQLRGMSAQERAAFRQGVLGGYLRDIENAQTNQNLANKLASRSMVLEKKLEVVFGSEQAFKDALTRYQQEQSMSRLGEIIGQSATSRRQQALFDVAEVAADVATSGPGGAARAMTQKTPGIIARGTARRMAPWFGAQGAEKLAEFLRRLPK